MTYEFTANAQIWPRALNSVLGGDPNGIYLVTADLGSPSGQGLDFISISLFFVPLIWCLRDLLYQMALHSCSASTPCTIRPIRELALLLHHSRKLLQTEA